ncbi:rhodanese-like domain-containing protein [Bacterioplanoides sp.]|uniref:rhodanese-like domain-containing protein n=1 Tax=Bacterioplanoides sp. TaxID=2066072 RepID=UPI003B0036FB
MSKIQHISLQQLASNPEALVIDVRTAAEVQSLGYAGSTHLPLQALTKEQVCAACDQHDGAVYVLCGSGKRAAMAAEQITDWLDHSIYVIEGGIQAMEQAGMALVRGDSNIISLERQVRIAAGLLVVTGVVLGATVSPYGYGLSAFVGAGLMFAGITDSCAMGMVLARMPWNKS